MTTTISKGLGAVLCRGTHDPLSHGYNFLQYSVQGGELMPYVQLYSIKGYATQKSMPTTNQPSPGSENWQGAWEQGKHSGVRQVPSSSVDTQYEDTQQRSTYSALRQAGGNRVNPEHNNMPSAAGQADTHLQDLCSISMCGVDEQVSGLGPAMCVWGWTVVNTPNFKKCELPRNAVCL